MMWLITSLKSRYGLISCSSESFLISDRASGRISALFRRLQKVLFTDKSEVLSEERRVVVLKCVVVTVMLRLSLETYCKNLLRVLVVEVQVIYI